MICARGGGEELFVCFGAHTPETGARKSCSTGSKLEKRAREETVTLLFLMCPADSTGTQCGRANPLASWAYAPLRANKHDATQRSTNYREDADGQGPHLHRRNALLWTAGGVCLFVNLHVRQRASGDKFPLETVLLALVQCK